MTEVETEAAEVVEGSESSPEQQRESGEQKRINQLTAEKWHLKKQLEALQNTPKPQAKQDQEVKLPEIPEEPDPDLLQEDPKAYHQQMKAYNEALFESKLAQSKQAEKQAMAERQKQEAANAQQLEDQKLVTSFLEGGLDAGLTEEQMTQNEQVLRYHGLDARQDIVRALYGEKDGAKLVDFLAKNPSELSRISSMTLYQLGAEIATNLRPKALQTKPSVSGAPDPIDPTVGGSGVADSFRAKYPNAKFK